MELNAVVLPAELGIEHAGELQNLLAPFLSRRGTVVLDAPDVAHLHTAALQVLASFVRTRSDAGGTTEWRHAAAPLREAAARAGLESLLGLAPGQAA